MIFIFSENMILPPDGKWKIIFLKKKKNKKKRNKQKTRKYDIFFQCPEKMVFSKGITLGYDLSCTICKGGIFSWKHGSFSPDEREMTFLKKYTETWYFLFDVFHAPLQKKKKKIKDDPIPQKIHLKVIDTLDQHPRKGSSNSLYFHGDLYSRFHILISSEKKEKKT